MNRGPECNDRCYGESCVHEPQRLEAPRHVYISGPMRGRDAFNFPAFFTAEKVLSAMFPTAEFFNPARADIVASYTDVVNPDDPQHMWKTVGGLFEGDPTGLTAGRALAGGGKVFTDADLREALGRDMAFICQKADMIVMLDGWEGSMGAKAEKALCEALGVPVWYQQGALDVFGAPEAVSVAPAGGCDLGRRLTVEDFLVTSGAKARAQERVDNEEENLQWISDRIFRKGEGSEPITFYDERAEHRTTAASGGEKGVKLARFDLIPVGPLTALAEHYGRGARKYADHQWRKGYEWSKSYGAALRHWVDFWGGHDWDVCPEGGGPGCQEVGLDGEPFIGWTEHGRTCFNHTGSHHLDAAAWHAFCLREEYDTHPENDDRYREAPRDRQDDE